MQAVIATGGLAPVVIDECRTITHHEPMITLIGLRMVVRAQRLSARWPVPRSSHGGAVSAPCRKTASGGSVERVRADQVGVTAVSSTPGERRVPLGRRRGHVRPRLSPCRPASSGGRASIRARNSARSTGPKTRAERRGVRSSVAGGAGSRRAARRARPPTARPRRGCSRWRRTSRPAGAPGRSPACARSGSNQWYACPATTASTDASAAGSPRRRPSSADRAGRRRRPAAARISAVRLDRHRPRDPAATRARVRIAGAGAEIDHRAAARYRYCPFHRLGRIVAGRNRSYVVGRARRTRRRSRVIATKARPCVPELDRLDARTAAIRASHRQCCGHGRYRSGFPLRAFDLCPESLRHRVPNWCGETVHAAHGGCRAHWIDAGIALRERSTMHSGPAGRVDRADPRHRSVDRAVAGELGRPERDRGRTSLAGSAATDPAERDDANGRPAN